MHSEGEEFVLNFDFKIPCRDDTRRFLFLTFSRIGTIYMRRTLEELELLQKKKEKNVMMILEKDYYYCRTYTACSIFQDDTNDESIYYSLSFISSTRKYLGNLWRHCLLRMLDACSVRKCYAYEVRGLRLSSS